MTEVLYPDGSIATFHQNGGSTHDGKLAIERLRLITAKNALRFYLDTGMQLTRNGAHLAIVNVIQPMTGKKYKRSREGKEEALADCQLLLDELEHRAVVY